jgi:hypothetical protein
MEDVRFVYKGRYYRRPIAPMAKNPEVPELLKVPLTGQLLAPPPLKTPPNVSAQTMLDALVASTTSAVTAEKKVVTRLLAGC